MNTNAQVFEYHATAYAPLHPTLIYRLTGYAYLLILVLIAILLVLLCVLVWKKISN